MKQWLCRLNASRESNFDFLVMLSVHGPGVAATSFPLQPVSVLLGKAQHMAAEQGVASCGAQLPIESELCKPRAIAQHQRSVATVRRCAAAGVV